MSTTQVTDRAALARSALARAEERTGARRWTRTARPPSPRDGVEGGQQRTSADRGAVVPVHQDPAAGDRLLGVAEHLVHLMPQGGLVRGSAVVVQGSTSLALGLLAEASRDGRWAAVVGLPEVGVLAAHEAGVVLDRVALVPAPGLEGPGALAALVDGMDLVLVGPRVALGDADRRRLAARARDRGAVLLTTTDWPGAHLVLEVERTRWDGLGRGHGRLRTCTVTVHRQGRGAAGRELRTEVELVRSTVPWAHGSTAARRPAAVPTLLDLDPRAGLPGGRRAG